MSHLQAGVITVSVSAGAFVYVLGFLLGRFNR